MKRAIAEVMREFYVSGVPEGVVRRDLEYAEKLRAATVVKGMRRTGKTFVTYQRMRELIGEGVEPGRIVHLNFEDDRLSGMRAEDLRLINEVHAELYPELAAMKCWYFLDEIQNIPGWEAYARRLVDSAKVVVWITGSSAKLLSAEIATQMRGRSIPVETFPLSFREYLRFNGIMEELPKAGFTPTEKGVLRKASRDYLEKGGFPDVQGLSDRMRAEMLQGYVDAVVYRDVLERHSVPSLQALRYTLDYLLHNYARKTSARAISGVLKNLGVSANRESVSGYLDHFCDAYLAYRVSVSSGSLAVKRVNPDKFYLVDTGLVRAMCAKSDAEAGWMLENAVFMALRRRFCKIEYYLTRDGREVDFLTYDRVDGSRRLVQASWEMSGEGTFERELGAIVAARAETGVEDCTIVTFGEEGERDGVRIVPLWRWLVEG